MDEVTVRLEGVDELKNALRALPRKIREKAVLSALKKAGQVISLEAKKNAPVLTGPVPKNRTRGLVKRKISVRTSKYARQNGDAGVFIGVRPAKGAKFRTVNYFGIFKVRKKTRSSDRGANSPLDPYYWWWQEFGWNPRGPGKALRSATGHERRNASRSPRAAAAFPASTS